MVPGRTRIIFNKNVAIFGYELGIDGPEQDRLYCQPSILGESQAGGLIPFLIRCVTSGFRKSILSAVLNLAIRCARGKRL